MSRGADTGARDCEGTTAAYHARQRRHYPIASFLLDISGDGDILLVEEPPLINEVHTAAGKAGPLYTSVCIKNKKRLPALDYEVVELTSASATDSSQRETRVETVKGSRDSGDKRKPTDKKKDAKKSEKRMVYENTEIPLVSATPLETGCFASVSNTRHNGAKEKSLCDEKRHDLKTSREDFGLVSDSATNSTALNERAARDRCDESNEVAKHKQQPGRRQHCYEEIKLPDESVTDPTVSCDNASVEESINMTKGRFVKRNHVYEEIELPSDTTPHSEIGLQNHTTFPCTQNATSNAIANNSRWIDHYEELKIPSDTADPTSNILNESATVTEEEIIPTIDISNFVRRPHPYEEIRLSKVEDSNKTDLNEHQVEQEVRQLLRKEMRQLELLGNAVDVDNSSRGSNKHDSDAIRSFFNVSETGEDVAPDSHYDVAAVITLRQLKRLLREEFQRFSDQLRLTGPLSKLGVQNKEDHKLVQTSASMSSATGLYDEIPNCGFGETGSELGKIETIKPAPRQEDNPREDIGREEKKQRDDSPPCQSQSTVHRKPEIAEQTIKESKLNFSPLLLRRDPRNRKEKGNENRSPNRSPLRLNVQNDKTREVTGPKMEEDLQKSDELSVKAGQSKFYVSLARSNKHSEI